MRQSKAATSTSLLATSVIVVVALTCAASANAQTRYVSDELVITVRTGPSTQNAIIRNLTTGDAVTVLEQNADGNYQRVRTETGVEGWVLTRYLTDTPVAQLRLATAERNLTQAREHVAELEGTAGSLTEQLADMSRRAQEAEAAASNLSAELGDVRTASANALTIRDQNESLRQRLNERNLELEALVTQNAALASRANREWFVLGAGVLVAGIVLGLIIPSLRRKRRTDW